MICSGKFNDKKILLIDKEPKIKNDRTWCFWEKENGFFEELVYRKWNKISFLSNDFSSAMDISPYQYKMIKGIDFYNYCFDEIKKHSNIELAYGHSGGGFYHKEGITLVLDGRQIELQHAVIFNSIYNSPAVSNGYIHLLQHFKGWIIETISSSFNTHEAILMDFRVSQEYGTAFAYVLPLSETKALVEYTFFTKNLLKQAQYDEALRFYLKDFLKIDHYSVVEQEFGVIPMTNEKFQFYRNGAYHIGTAGGQTKSSSGYTFQFIQKQSQEIVDCMIRDELLYNIPETPKRFRFYDNILLDILNHKRYSGKKIFTDLFKKNKSQQVFKFLDNETSLKEEIKIISSLPVFPFLKAALRQL